MDKQHYNEMLENFKIFEDQHIFIDKKIYLFGHCNATEELIELFESNGYKICGILDNNISKQGTVYKDIHIISPEEISLRDNKNTIVCIVARAYESMAKQLKQMGFMGIIKKLVDYNTYAEYSLSDDVVSRKKQRLDRGIKLLSVMKDKYPDYVRIYCPFAALGDVFYAMSYLPYFLEKRQTKKYAVFTIGKGCAEVVRMFGSENVEALTQKEMDESVQAILYTNDENAYIAHHDRPYPIYLAKALYIRKIPFEMLYKYGVFGLEKSCIPYKPSHLKKYGRLDDIPKGRSVIISPYAKSVTNINNEYWVKIVQHFTNLNYKIFTNAVGSEQALNGTEKLDISLSEFQSAAEQAGIFIGLRSGLCDIIKYAKCRKIALYPDCCYSDTKWKMEEIYHLDGWENIVIGR